MTYSFREYYPGEAPDLDEIIADVRRDERLRVLRELATEMGDRLEPRCTIIEREWADELDRRADMLEKRN
jgi:hypothetical protein